VRAALNRAATRVIRWVVNAAVGLIMLGSWVLLYLIGSW